MWDPKICQCKKKKINSNEKQSVRRIKSIVTRNKVLISKEPRKFKMDAQQDLALGNKIVL